MKKTCFVVMGFGKKMDYFTSKEIDLDIIYNKVIKSLFQNELPDYELVRSDEILCSGIIDSRMYQLLMQADLVIADITTYNANALYELGTRHALRPYATIIMMQKSGIEHLPFDLSHSNILTYHDYGINLDDSEADEIKKELKKFVLSSQRELTDSPLYTYLPDVKSPYVKDDDYRKYLQKKENSIAALRSQAEKFKKGSNFSEAVPLWKSLHTLLPKNEYITQQLAFCLYKSELPDKYTALLKALKVINSNFPHQHGVLNLENSIFQPIKKA